MRELLRFYADAGVDEALVEEAADRFGEAAPPRLSPFEGEIAPHPYPLAVNDKERGASASRPASFSPPAGRRSRQGDEGQAAPPPPSPTVPDETQAARARELAREARTLDELRAILGGFDGCNLRLTAKNLVFADGNPEADLMLVGEAPGRDEDIEGRPFVGRSGRLLDRILAAIGLDRGSAYIANVIPWRPPGNRDPSPLETEICRPFIERQIELVNPKVLVTLGNPSTKLLLKTQTGIMRMRGKWSVHVTPSGLEIPAMPTLHPAYLLRTPAHKKFAWRDFLEVKMRLRG